MTAYVGALESLTLKNSSFRRVIFTAVHSQIVLMSLLPGEEIGEEVHSDVDQFFRVEQGEAGFVFGEREPRLARDGDAVLVPAGTQHNVVNTSRTKLLKMYTIYSPPNHPEGTIHETRADAEAAERGTPT